MFKIWKLSNNSFLLIDARNTQIALGNRDSMIVTLVSLRVDHQEVSYMLHMFDNSGHTVADFGVCNTVIITQYLDPINIPTVNRGSSYAA
jgi:hypothetical protein